MCCGARQSQLVMQLKHIAREDIFLRWKALEYTAMGRGSVRFAILSNGA